MNRTGGPVRPRQNYTYATRQTLLCGAFRDTVTDAMTDSAGAVSTCGLACPAAPSQRPVQPHRSRGPLASGQSAASRPSSTERACAASMAAMSAARTPCRSSSRIAATVVPARAGDRLAQLHRVLARVAHHHRRAQRRLHDQVGGQRARQARAGCRRRPSPRPGRRSTPARCPTAP